MKLTRLYKTAKSGATQIIDMAIDGDTYTRTWGQLEGKQQSKSTTAKPKNVGRSNETTGAEQAIIEANAVWAKKQKANYSTSMEAPVLVELPMKVNVYQKHLKKIKFPLYVSPKLNGVNVEYRRTSEGLVLLSRGGESYTIPEHQRAEIMATMMSMGVSRLNGEMYIHGEHLQDITGALKKFKDHITPRLEFHVFDIPSLPGTYKIRERQMSLSKDTTFVKFVPVLVVNSFEEIESNYEDVMAEKYEGLMVRLPDGLYEYNTRSLSVFKYKKIQDAEFLITGVNEDKNGHPVFVFKSDGGEFKAKPKGTSDERAAMLKDSSNYIGKYATVEYEMLSKGSGGNPGVPLKPVMIVLRKVDENGEAIE